MREGRVSIRSGRVGPIARIAAAGVWGVFVLALGCGGGGGGSPMGPSNDPPAGPAPLLDFSAIAGTWSGWDVPKQTWIRFTLEPSARQNETVGEQVTGGQTGQELRITCRMDLVAVAIVDGVYSVRLIPVPGSPPHCRGGEIDMVYDQAAGTLTQDFKAFDNSFEARVVATPGEDPGLLPEPPEEEF